MILDEVEQFRRLVRAQQPAPHVGGGVAQAHNLPIPDNSGQWSHEDPRPQEAAMSQHASSMGLEQELQGGLDAMHR